MISKINFPLNGLTFGSLRNDSRPTLSWASETVVTLFVLVHGEQNSSLLSSFESTIDSLSEQVARAPVNFTSKVLMVTLADDDVGLDVNRHEH